MEITRRTFFRRLNYITTFCVSCLFDLSQTRAYVVRRTVFFPNNKNITDYIEESQINLKAIRELDDHFLSKGYLLNMKTFSKSNKVTYQYSFKSKKIYSIWRKKARIACNINETSLKNNGHQVIWNYWTGRSWQSLV